MIVVFRARKTGHTNFFWLQGDINGRRGEYNGQQVMQSLGGEGEPIQVGAVVKASPSAVPKGMCYAFLIGT